MANELAVDIDGDHQRSEGARHQHIGLADRALVAVIAGRLPALMLALQAPCVEYQRADDRDECEMVLHAEGMLDARRVLVKGEHG